MEGREAAGQDPVELERGWQEQGHLKEPHLLQPPREVASLLSALRDPFLVTRWQSGCSQEVEHVQEEPPRVLEAMALMPLRTLARGQHPPCGGLVQGQVGSAEDPGGSGAVRGVEPRERTAGRTALRCPQTRQIQATHSVGTRPGLSRVLRSSSLPGPICSRGLQPCKHRGCFSFPDARARGWRPEPPLLCSEPLQGRQASREPRDGRGEDSQGAALPGLQIRRHLLFLSLLEASPSLTPGEK